MQKLFLVLSTTIFVSVAAADPVRVPTRNTGTWITTQGIMKMPYRFDEAKSYKQLRNDPGLKPYFDYQLSLSHKYGHERDDCFSLDLAFLPGKTEAAFRQSQVQWVKTLETPTPKNKPFPRYTKVGGVPDTKASLQRTQRDVDPSGRLSAETFIYRDVHKGSNASITHEWFHIYTFMYDKKLSQGVMLFCKTNKMYKR